MFQILRPDSWETTRRLVQHLTGWGFRGQEDSSWGLETTLYRSARRYGLEVKSLVSREIWILKQFQRRAHHYINAPPPPERLIEWLALIQHYGGPTRLLDFTHSFYVAAFFALERATHDSAIWAVSLFDLEEALRKKGRLKGKGDTIDVSRQKLVSVAEPYIRGKVTDKLVLYVEPERLNERLSTQQGLFLLPGDITSSFADNLAAAFDVPSDVFQNVKEKTLSIKDLDEYFVSSMMVNLKVLKIILPGRSITLALHDLSSMNITSATLFPGLDGFARSLFYHLRPSPKPGTDDEYFDLPVNMF